MSEGNVPVGEVHWGEEKFMEMLVRLRDVEDRWTFLPGSTVTYIR
jgi:hypothetical protein